METWQLYLLIGVVPQLGEILFLVSAVATGLVLAAVGVLYLIGWIEEEDKPREWGAKISKWVAIPMAVNVFAAFFPSLQMMLVLVGWELGTSIEGIEELPANVVEYLGTALEQAQEQPTN